MKSNFSLILIFSVILIFSSGFKRPGFYKNIDGKTGDTLDMTRYKGKVVVMNFWASWSKASRGENKSLQRVYQVYRLNPKVTFVSVSLDTDEASWKTAIEEDELSWKDHFCDFKKYNSPMAIKYGVNTLPRFLVFDVQGKQVYSALNAHDLETEISKLLK